MFHITALNAIFIVFCATLFVEAPGPVNLKSTEETDSASSGSLRSSPSRTATTEAESVILTATAFNKALEGLRNGYVLHSAILCYSGCPVPQNAEVRAGCQRVRDVWLLYARHGSRDYETRHFCINHNYCRHQIGEVPTFDDNEQRRIGYILSYPHN